MRAKEYSQAEESKDREPGQKKAKAKSQGL
jgi:hypothetical protein